MTEIKEQLSQLNKMSNKSEALYHKVAFLLVSLIAHLGYCIRCWTQRRRALSMTCAASGLFPSKLSTPP